MSAIILEKIQTRPFADSDSTCYIRAVISCDTAADLPAATYFSGYTLEQASKAHVISDNQWYMLQSSGTWVQQVPEEIGYTYTKAEIDSLISDVQDAADDAQDAADAAQADIDSVKNTVLTDLIDTGAKNLCETSGGSNVLPTRWLQIPIVLPVGQYVVKIGTLSSDDTDASTCQFVCFASDNSVTSNYLYLSRGSNVSGILNITAETAYLRLYPSDSYAHSADDTVTAADIMICKKADYDISDVIVPYCPTLAELYALVKSYHP